MKPDELAARGVRVKAIRIEGDVAYVPLTKGYEAVIDAADVHLVKGRPWHAKPDKSCVYARTNVQKSDGTRTTVMMHQLLTGFAMTDHINGDGLCNRRSNLRAATIEQNNQNAAKPRTNTSGIKGVTWDRQRNKWRATISVGSKGVHLGYFSTPDDAAAVYAKASAKHHGEFGRTA